MYAPGDASVTIQYQDLQTTSEVSIQGITKIGIATPTNTYYFDEIKNTVSFDPWPCQTNNVPSWGRAKYPRMKSRIYS